MSIPAPLAVHYQIATPQSVRSRSHGAVKLRQNESAVEYESHQRGTLRDQVIFGPIRDFECACGKYEGQRFQGTICDHCGVKIGPTTLRSTRFGHIELNNAIPHPLSEEASLACFPVLPARYFESPSGEPLVGLYEDLIGAVENRSTDAICSTLHSICEVVLPVLLAAVAWRLSEASILGQGVALELKQDHSIYCPQCGYLLAGLESMNCPGCRLELQ